MLDAGNKSKRYLLFCIAAAMPNDFTAFAMPSQLLNICCWKLRTVIVDFRVDQQADRESSVLQDV